jgi:L-fucose isomerase-like protein
MLKPKVGSYAVYEPTEEGWQDLNQQFQQVNADLRRAGLEVIEAPEPVCDEGSCNRVAAWFTAQDIDILHALIITWSFDHYTVRIQQVVGLPVAIRTIPGIRSGSIVGGQQLGCILTDLEVEHRLFYGDLGNLETSQEIAVYVQACGLQRRLKGARFLMLGRRTPGMTPIAVDEVEIMRLFGARLVQLGMDEFTSLAAKEPITEAEAEWKSVSTQAAAISCSPEHAIASMRNYLAMKQLASDWNLQGITVGSYPDCQGTACLPIALLNNEGIVAGCEGDMNSTIAMYLLYQLSGIPVHFGEMLAVDEKENYVVSSHCGAAAPGLADKDGYMLCPVRLAHRGVCIRFKSRPGPVTYVNLVGRKDNYRLCAFEGNAVPTEMVFEGNPLRIQLKTPFRQIWENVSWHGFGHHWMSAYAHVTPALAEFCRLIGIEGVFPDDPGLNC